MNKYLILSALLMTGLLSPASAVCNRQSSRCSTQQAASTAGSVPKALSKLSFIQGKPDLEAKYYIYLHSASWCGPCRRAMPSIVEAYDEMRKAGFEVILMGHDKTAALVKKYAASHNAEFPALLDSDKSTTKLPGYKPAYGIPHFYVVDRNGEQLHEDHPINFFQDGKWKSYVNEWSKTTGTSDAKTDSGSSCSGGSCSGSSCSDSTNNNDGYTITCAADMNEMLKDMVENLTTSQIFTSNLRQPYNFVWQTLVGCDQVIGYGVCCRGNKFSLQTLYGDATRMLYAHRNELTSASEVNGATESEMEALAILQDRLKNLVKDGMKTEEIVLAIHDDLVNRASYSFNGDCYSATGIIKNDTGVCNAYSLYMCLALNMVGIPCHRVVGNNGFCHAWNLVQIDDEWYHLDATWDDPICCNSKQQILRHTYFCVSDDTISKDHSWDRNIYPASAKKDLKLPSCGSYTSQKACSKAMRLASSGGCKSLEGCASFASNKASFSQYLAQINSKADSNVRVSSYVYDPSTGHFIINFSSDGSTGAPQELTLEKNPVETNDTAAAWRNTTSPELETAAKEAMQKLFAPTETPATGTSSWENLLKESQNVLKQGTGSNE